MAAISLGRLAQPRVLTTVFGFPSACLTRCKTPGDARAKPRLSFDAERLKTTPMTCPASPTSGPPEFPGRTVASSS